MVDLTGLYLSWLTNHSQPCILERNAHNNGCPRKYMISCDHNIRPLTAGTVFRDCEASEDRSLFM